MLRSRIVVSAVTALILWPGSIVAQEQPEAPAAPPAEKAGEELPSAESLFERHYELVGGDDAFENMTSREIKGRVRNDNMNFLARIHIWAVAPNKMRADIDAPGLPSTTKTYDGEIGWVSSDDNYALIEGKALVDLALTSDFFGEANYKERYKTIETAETGKFIDRDVYLVNCVSHDGKPSIALFDAETGFIIGAQTTMTSEAGTARTILILKDYEDIGGMLWPKTIVQVTGNGETVITYRSVTVNEVDESVFDRPEAVEKLLAEKKDAEDDG